MIEAAKPNQNIGLTLLERIQEAGLISLRPTGRIADLTAISCIILIGSSATGKSTIQKAIVAAKREGIFETQVSIPRRVVTRPPRLDDGEEVVHCTTDNFEQQIRNGSLGLFGIKTMESGRREPFGLEKPANDTVLAIFFANNVIVKDPDSIQPQSIFEKALIIGIYTPDTVRKERLHRRSPELFDQQPEEISFRLSESERSAIVFRRAHIVVKNFPGERVNYEQRTTQDVIDLIKLILQLKEEQSAVTN